MVADIQSTGYGPCMHGITERQMFIHPCLYPSTTPVIRDVEAKTVKMELDKPVDLIRALKQEEYHNFLQSMAVMHSNIS